MAITGAIPSDKLPNAYKKFGAWVNSYSNGSRNKADYIIAIDRVIISPGCWTEVDIAVYNSDGSVAERKSGETDFTPGNCSSSKPKEFYQGLIEYALNKALGLIKTTI